MQRVVAMCQKALKSSLCFSELGTLKCAHIVEGFFEHLAKSLVYDLGRRGHPNGFSTGSFNKG